MNTLCCEEQIENAIELAWVDSITFAQLAVMSSHTLSELSWWASWKRAFINACKVSA